MLRDTREVTASEHYRYSADRPKPRKPPEHYRYVEELAHLQFELINLQEWVRLQGLRVVVIFEGPRRGRQGGRHQAHHPELEPAHLPRLGARHADRARARPMVFSALCRPKLSA